MRLLSHRYGTTCPHREILQQWVALGMRVPTYPEMPRTCKNAKIRWNGPLRGAPLNPSPCGGAHWPLGRNNFFTFLFWGDY